MDKGVRNNHQGHVTVSGAGEDGSDLILKPGFNRLTVEQYRALKAVPVIQNYFKREVRLLEDVAAPVQTEELEEELDENGEPSRLPQGEAKPLDRMNKEELVRRARELGVAHAEDATKADIIKAIQEAAR